MNLKCFLGGGGGDNTLLTGLETSLKDLVVSSLLCVCLSLCWNLLEFVSITMSG